MSDVSTTVVDGSSASNVDMTMAEGKATAPVENAGPTAETLGVTQAQFDKFHKDGAYNWEAHAKEAEFAAAQKGTKADDNPDEGARDVKDADDTNTDAAEQAVTEAGLDWDALGETIVENGDITESDYEALAKIGVPEPVIKEYIEGITERAKTQVATVTEALGGAEGLKAVTEFAQANYSPEEISKLEQQLASPTEYKLAVDLLLAKSGRPPIAKGAAIAGPNAAAPGTTDVQPYATQADMIADQRNPQYKKSPAFRAEVFKRAAVSNWTAPTHTGGM